MVQSQSFHVDQQRSPARSPTWLDKQLLRELDGNLRKAYYCYAIAFALILGTALMIFPAAIAIFVDSVGIQRQPVAQSYLPLVFLPVLLFYNFLYAAIRNPARLALIMCSIYAVIYFVIAFRAIWDENVGPLLAWVLFYTTNTKSVLFPVMFWSIMNDISIGKTADGVEYSKITYPVIVLAGQLGGFAGSLLAANNEFIGGAPTLLIVQAVALLLAAFFLRLGCSLSSLERPQNCLLNICDSGSQIDAMRKPTGGLKAGLAAVGAKICEVGEGVYLILTEPYVAGLFWIAAAHLVPRGILDYQGTVLINQRWPKLINGEVVPGNKDRQTAIFAWCNVACTLGTALLAQFGLRKLVEKGGLAVALMACPTVMLISVLLVCFNHEFWTIQVTLVLVNSVQYALNGPCREMLYVRTSKNIKYKAKSWSDMYGNFIQKTLAAQINLHVNQEVVTGPNACSPNCFQPVVTATGTVAWVVIWASISASLGVRHSQLARYNQKIGEDGVGCCKGGQREPEVVGMERTE